MSYSRWSNSTWYTFWCAPLNKNKLIKDLQIFEVCSVMSFTYKELKESIDKCVDKIREISLDVYSEDEYNELKQYMKEFISDVDEEFSM